MQDLDRLALCTTVGAPRAAMTSSLRPSSFRLWIALVIPPLSTIDCRGIMQEPFWLMMWTCDVDDPGT